MPGMILGVLSMVELVILVNLGLIVLETGGYVAPLAFLCVVAEVLVESHPTA